MAQTISRSAATIAGHPSSPASSRSQRPNHRMAGLTGIGIVVLTAANLGLPLPGGYLAMEVLMVCIGFEAARTLRRLVDEPKRLTRYWLCELVPLLAIAAVAVGLSTLYWSAQGELGGPELQAVVGGLTMTLNFFMVYGNADLAAIDHLWALGIIFQFLAIAPIMAWVGRHRLNANGRAATLLGAAGGVAVCRLGFLVSGAAEEGSIALNTLTRVDALLIGLAIGIAPLATLRRYMPTDLAPPALAMLLLLFIAAPAQGDIPLITLGLLVTTAICLTAVVAAWTAIGGLDGALRSTLDNRILQWLGHRALSIYVWHQLFGLTLSADGFVPIEQMQEWPGSWVFIARIVFSLAAAATSHRYLEIPTRTAAANFLNRVPHRETEEENLSFENWPDPDPAQISQDDERPRRRSLPASAAATRRRADLILIERPAPQIAAARLMKDLASVNTIGPGANHPVHRWPKPRGTESTPIATPPSVFAPLDR